MTKDVEGRQGTIDADARRLHSLREALVELHRGKGEAALDLARKVERRAARDGYVETELHAAMVKALALLDIGRTAKAADVGEAIVESCRNLDTPPRLEVELHLAAARALSLAHRAGAAERARSRARAALERRAAPIDFEGPRGQLLADIEKGLPKEIREDAETLARGL